MLFSGETVTFSAFTTTVGKTAYVGTDTGGPGDVIVGVREESFLVASLVWECSEEGGDTGGLREKGRCQVIGLDLWTDRTTNIVCLNLADLLALLCCVARQS